MRDEFEARIWNSHHNAADTLLTQISEDCVRGMESARDAFLRKARNIGFHSAAVIAATVVSGAAILAAAGPVTGA